MAGIGRVFGGAVTAGGTGDAGPQRDFYFDTSTVFTVPAGAKRLDISCFGGGGSAGENQGVTVKRAGGGGGAGYFTHLFDVAVTPGQQYAVTVGASDGASAFGALLTAEAGGKGGNGLGGNVGAGGHGSAGGAGNPGGNGVGTTGGTSNQLGGSGGSYKGTNGQNGQGVPGGVGANTDEYYAFCDRTAAVAADATGGCTMSSLYDEYDTSEMLTEGGQMGKNAIGEPVRGMLVGRGGNGFGDQEANYQLAAIMRRGQPGAVCVRVHY